MTLSAQGEAESNTLDLLGSTKTPLCQEILPIHNSGARQLFFHGTGFKTIIVFAERRQPRLQERDPAGRKMMWGVYYSLKA